MSAPAPPVEATRPALDAADPPPGPTDRRLTALLVWMGLILSGLLAVSRAADLRYLKGDRWPSDIYAFNHLELRELDVAVLGSSRSVFGLPPQALGACLERSLGRPVQAVNLGRYFASPVGESVIARDVLVGERAPKVAIAEIAPGTVNRYYSALYYDMRENGRLADVLPCLAASQNVETLVSCSRPLLRGLENVAWLLTDRIRDADHETTWMMLYQGGGQYCYGSPQCVEHTASYGKTLARHWTPRVEKMLPRVRAERFARFEVGAGVGHDYLTSLADWAEAEGVELILLNMPVHRLYQQEIPATDYAAYLAYVEAFAADRGIQLIDANDHRWQGDRKAFFDPDHLNPRGAQTFSAQICRQIAPTLRGAP